MALLLSGFSPDAAKTVLSFFLALKLEKGIVLHVLKSTLVNLFLTKEGSCSGNVLMAFCFDEDLEGGIFPCNPYKNVPNFGQILNVSKICVLVMQKLAKVSHLTAIKVFPAAGGLCIQSTSLFMSWLHISVNGLYCEQAPENLCLDGN